MIAASVALGACGGGGGSSGSPPPPSGGGTPPPPPPPPPPPADPGNLQTTVPAPTYAAGSVELTMFNQINDWRSKGGFGLVAQSDKLDAAAKAHATYNLANCFKADASGVSDAECLSSTVTPSGWLAPHTENPAKPLFTGILPVDRAVAAGYPAVYVAESIGWFVSASSCAANLYGSVFHRATIISPQLRSIGASSVAHSTGLFSVCVIDPAYSTVVGKVPDGWIGLVPYDGQTGLNGTFFAESPDPVPGSTKGFPVSIQIASGRTLGVTKFEITPDGSSTPVPAKLLTKTDFPAYLGAEVAFLVPLNPLTAATKYNVTFTGTNNGANFSKSWTFTTK
jgi:hypothetical protein